MQSPQQPWSTKTLNCNCNCNAMQLEEKVMNKLPPLKSKTTNRKGMNI